jgi:hypothetical protein
MRSDQASMPPQIREIAEAMLPEILGGLLAADTVVAREDQRRFAIPGEGN